MTDKTPLNLHKSQLKDFILIGQMDSKFILCKLKTKEVNLIVCLDQHAVDERIRLEAFESVFNRDMVDIHFLGHPIKFEKRIQNQIKIHEKDFKRWGIIVNDHGIIGYPDVFKTKLEKDVIKFKKIVIDHLQSLQEGLSNAQMPQGFRTLLNSMACRSAIKFGDLLSRDECQDLILKLCNCDFPFQCMNSNSNSRCAWTTINDSIIEFK